MNNYSDRRGFIEAALIAAITTIFIISITYIPILSLTTLLIPVPFMILAYRNNMKYSLLSFITFCLLVGILTGIVNATFIISVFGPMTLAMSYFFKKERDAYFVIGAGTLASILSILILFGLISYVGNINIIDQISIMAENIMNTQIELLKTMDMNVINVDQILDYFFMIFPGMLIIQAMFMSFGNYYFTANILKRFVPKDIKLPQFSNFRLPSNIVLGSFLILVLSYLTTYIEGIYHISLITNVILIFIFLFLLQGIAVISYFIKKTSIPKAVRIILIALIFLISPLLTAISFVGLIDAMMDIRRLRSNNSNDEI